MSSRYRIKSRCSIKSRSHWRQSRIGHKVKSSRQVDFGIKSNSTKWIFSSLAIADLTSIVHTFIVIAVDYCGLLTFVIAKKNSTNLTVLASVQLAHLASTFIHVSVTAFITSACALTQASLIFTDFRQKVEFEFNTDNFDFLSTSTSTPVWTGLHSYSLSYCCCCCCCCWRSDCWSKLLSSVTASHDVMTTRLRDDARSRAALYSTTSFRVWQMTSAIFINENENENANDCDLLCIKTKTKVIFSEWELSKN